MTMHLLGPAYSTIRTPRKAKLTKSKLDRFYVDWKSDCKREKKLGIKPKSFDDYIDYRLGYYKPKLRGVKPRSISLAIIVSYILLKTKSVYTIRRI